MKAEDNMRTFWDKRQENKCFKEYSAGWTEMIPDRNLNLHNEIKSIREGNMWVNVKYCFSSYVL